MHPLLALSTFPALLSTAQALVLHPLPRALTSLHDSTIVIQPCASETPTASHAIRAVTFASANLATAVVPTVTVSVSHGSSGALHSSDLDAHHGAILRASGDDSEFGRRESGLSEPEATRTLRKRDCFFFCDDGGLRPPPSTTPTPSKRDATGNSLGRRDLSAANQAPGVKERDNSARDVGNQDQEKKTPRKLPRSPKKPEETEAERESNEEESYGGFIARSPKKPEETEDERESNEEESYAGSIARSLRTPTQDQGVKERDVPAGELHQSDHEQQREELETSQTAEAEHRRKEEEATASQKAAAAQQSQAAQQAQEGTGGLSKRAGQLPR